MVEYYQNGYSQDGTCNERCGSTCCYISARTISLTEEEIAEIINGLRNGDYLECYVPEIREIIKKGFVIKWGTQKYLKNKTGCGGYEDCMRMKRPCIFLYKDRWSLFDDGACMIYPHRPQMCKDTHDGFLVCTK